jgi:hypothetical protein
VERGKERIENSEFCFGVFFANLFFSLLVVSKKKKNINSPSSPSAASSRSGPFW